MNLRIDGKVVRTATGQDREELEPASWDVAELKGRHAVIEIVDQSSEGWGHINIDQIIFSDIVPEPILRQGTMAEAVAKAFGVSFTAAEEATAARRRSARRGRTSPGRPRAVAGEWKVQEYTRLVGFHVGRARLSGAGQPRRTAIRW